MGVGHCIVNGCADVFYQEYLPPSVRWQYGNEPWQEIIEADDYSITPTFGSPAAFDWQYDMGYSVLSYSAFNPSSPSQGCNNSMAQLRRCARQRVNPQLVFDNSRIQSSFYSPIYKFRVSDYAQSDLPCANAGLNYAPLACTRPEGYRKIEIFAHKTASSPNPEWIVGWLGTRNFTPGYMLQVPTGGEYPIVYNPSLNKYVGIFPSSYGWGYFDFVHLGNVARTGLLLEVYKNGQVVHSETRAVSPQVEVLPTRLDPLIKRLEIKKTPFLDRVDVLANGIGRFSDPTGISDVATDGVIVKYPIPPECLNVYKNTNDQSFPVNGAPELLPYVVPTNGFIAQICSYPGTPPPEYSVSCGCKCIKCPPNTCPITCGDVVCCYDLDGRAILTIPLADACEDMICGC